MTARTPQVGEMWKLGPCDVEVLAVHDGSAWVRGTNDGWPVTVDFDELTPGPPVADVVEEVWYSDRHGFAVDNIGSNRRGVLGWTIVATVARMSDGTYRIEQVTP